MSNRINHHDSGRRTMISCPHCSGATRIRSNREADANYRQLILRCVNDDCGATYGADLTITHGISPSGRPNPAVHLRMTPPRARAPRPANDTHASILAADGQHDLSVPEVTPRPANDDEVARSALG